MKKRKILVYVKGYYNCNLGDDLLFQTLVNRYPSVEFYFCRRKSYLQAISTEKNVKSVGRLESIWLRLVRKIKNSEDDIVENERIIHKADAVVIIGGSIFIEQDHWIYKKDYFKDKPVFYIGCNFGPYKSTEYFLYKKKLITECQDICFRDKYSYSLFSTLKNVRVAPDVIWSYPFFPASNINANGIAISVINLKGRKELEDHTDKYENVIYNICIRGQKKRIPVKLLSFCSAEGDFDAINRIIRRMPSTDGIEVICYDGNTADMLDAINSCQIVVATRFHAMVIGWSLEKKVIPIIYSDKQLHMLEDMDYQDYAWNIKAVDAFDYEEISLTSNLQNSKYQFEELKRNAEKQFKALDLFIDKQLM